MDEILDMVKHGLKAGKFAPKQDTFDVAKKRQVRPFIYSTFSYSALVPLLPCLYHVLSHSTSVCIMSGSDFDDCDIDLITFVYGDRCFIIAGEHNHQLWRHTACGGLHRCGH